MPEPKPTGKPKKHDPRTLARAAFKTATSGHEPAMASELLALTTSMAALGYTFDEVWLVVKTFTELARKRGGDDFAVFEAVIGDPENDLEQQP